MHQESEIAAKTHHIPLQFTPFVGREQELGHVLRRLSDPACRLVTIVGPGGIGKTRLAIEATAVSTPEFSDGTYFIDLQPVMTEELLLTTLAAALNISLSAQGEALQTIHEYLGDRQILLTMDNFDQLLDASPTLSQLLVGTRFKILVTSREALNLQEEWLYPISGLSYPVRSISSEDATGYSAVQLFTDRVRRVSPDFNLENEIGAIARICQMVEGMPLALELAAPWAKTLSCAEIAAEIERNRAFLTTRLRNVPERHRSMQAIFSQTWETLDGREQAVFQRLSLFRGGFLRDAAVSVAESSLSLLSVLVDKSLLRWESGERENGRYQIHELLRQFAEEKLAAHPEEADQAREKHGRYYTSFLAQRLDDLLGGRQKEAMLEIEAELNNIRPAWGWALEQKEWVAIDEALEPLHLFCDMHGRHVEGASMFQRACQQIAAETDAVTWPILGKLLCRYRFMQVFAPVSLEEMEADLRQSLHIAREHDDPLEKGVALLALGAFTYYVRKNQEAAWILIEESVPLFQAQKHFLYEARALAWLGVVHPELEGLVQYTQKSLDVARAGGDKMDMLVSLGNLAEVALGEGDYALAGTYCDEAIITADEMQLQLVSAHIRTLKSLVLFLQGELEQAISLAQEGLARSRNLNNKMAIAYAEGMVGLYHGVAGDYTEGRRLCEKSVANPANHGLGLVTAYWGVATAACGLELHDYTREAVRAGIQQAQKIGSRAMALWLFPVTAVLFHRRGYANKAAGLLALADSHPLSLTGWMGKWAILQETREALKREMETAVQKAGSLSLEKLVVEIETILEYPMTGPTIDAGGVADLDPAATANQALVEPMTNRELEVLECIAQGLSNRAIAEKLVISPGTVKYYTSQIYGKLQVANRTQAVARARELGILS